MSEAELHVLRARLRGGILNQAQRAALKLQLPVGLVYAEDNTVRLDPDAQVQQALRTLFATDHSDRISLGSGQIFSRTRTALSAPCPYWPPCRNHALGAAHPQYRAEASCAIRAMLGRSATDGPIAVNGWMAGSASRPSQRQAWPFLFQNAHVGYITWEDYEANRQQLRQNRQTFGGDRRHGPPREGPALLQGLVICGKCGNRMTIRYHQAEKGTHLIPEYVCQKERVEQATEQTCQHILGAGLDAAMADLLLAEADPFHN